MANKIPDYYRIIKVGGNVAKIFLTGDQNPATFFFLSLPTNRCSKMRHDHDYLPMLRATHNELKGTVACEDDDEGDERLKQWISL